MSRQLRLEFEGALYHLTARGDRREPIFEDDIDRQTLLEVVEQGLERFNAVIYSYCLMGNHYHFVLQTRQANLARLMRHINGVYAQRYNQRHGKVGHLFQGRFKAVVVDRDAYFLEVCRYVDLNPVRARMVAKPQDWLWSSYRAHTGLVPAPVWLDSDQLHWLLAAVDARGTGATRYANFVAQGHGVRLWDDALNSQIYLGDDDFVRRMQAGAKPPAYSEIPRRQRQMASHPLPWYFDRQERDRAIVQAFMDGGYTQSEIAQEAGLSVSRVSRLIKKAGAKGKT